MWKARCAGLSGDDCMRNITQRNSVRPKYQSRYASSMATFLLRIKKGFLNLFWEVITTQNCLIFVFLTNQLKELFMKSGLAKLKLKKNKFFHFLVSASRVCFS